MKRNGYALPNKLESSRRVLLVDGDPLVADMLADLFERDGAFTTRSAATAFTAGLMARSFAPDVLLLDYRLPGLDAAGVIDAVRRDEELRSAKIILFSGGPSADAGPLLAAGADAFFSKPPDIAKLMSSVKAMLGMDAEAPPRKHPRRAGRGKRSQ